MVLGKHMRAVWERRHPDVRLSCGISIQRVTQFIKFCVVGVSGLALDMIVLHLLANHEGLGLDVTFSKVCAAGTAMISNFLFNDWWTFRQHDSFACGRRTIRRFVLFCTICGIGIGIAVLLLHVFHIILAWNLYISNLLAISIVTVWNFGFNAVFNWVSQPMTTENYEVREKGFAVHE